MIDQSYPTYQQKSSIARIRHNAGAWLPSASIITAPRGNFLERQTINVPALRNDPYLAGVMAFFAGAELSISHGTT
jgi:hypothetical protein